MRIPGRFTLLGVSYTVRVVPESDWKIDDAVGYFLPHTHEILIRAGRQALVEQTYYHELCHAVLHAMGRDRLYRDEAFVDLFGAMLHQINSTAK